MSNGSLSNKNIAKSAVSSIASFARNIVAGNSSASSFVSKSTSSKAADDGSSAISSVKSIAHSANRTVDNLIHVDNERKSVAKAAINKYLIHTKSLLRNAVGNFTITGIVSDYRNNLNRVLNVIRIDDVNSLITNKIQTSDLSAVNKQLAAKETANVIKQAKNNINHSVNGRMIQDSFISGINAINGSLSKYAFNNRSNILRSFAGIIVRARNKVNSQNNLSLSAKSLANQEINHIYTRVRHDLHSTSNIASIDSIKKRGITLINQLLVDKNGILGELTNFDDYADLARDQINDLEFLSAQLKQKAIHFVDRAQKFVDGNVSYSRVLDINVDNQERKIARVVLGQSVRNVQRQFASYSSVTKGKRSVIVRQIQQRSLKINQKIHDASGSAIEIELSRGIQSLNSIIDRSSYSIFTDSVNRLIGSAQQRIRRMGYLSLVTKNKTEDQISSMGKSIFNKSKADLANFNLANGQKQIQLIKSHLQQLIHGSYLKSVLASVNYVVKSSQEQINNSNLSPLQKQQIIKKINDYRTSVRAKVIHDYDHHHDVNSQLNSGLKQITHSVRDSLIDDKNNNFDRIHQVIKSAYVQVSGIGNLSPSVKHQFNADLNQIALDSSHQINGANSFSKVDRVEQSYENQIYRKLSQIVGALDHSKNKAINLIFARTKKANDQINISNLSLISKRNFNNQVDRHGNLAIQKIVSSKGKLKGQFKGQQVAERLKHTLDDALQIDRKNNLRLINDAAQSAYNHVAQVKHAKFNVSKVLRQINNVKLNADRGINNSGSLASIDQEEQKSQNLINRVVNNVIGQVDRFKYLAHQKVSRLIKPMLKQINTSQHLANVDKHQVVSRIVVILNNLDDSINRGKDKDVDDEIRRSFNLIYKVFKRAYVRELTNIVKLAHLQVKKMSALSKVNKAKAIKAIHYIYKQTIVNISQFNDYQVISEIVVGSQHSVEQVLYQISDLDPVKHTAHSLINSTAYNLNEQIRDNHDLKVKDRQRILKRIMEINRRANFAIDQSNDMNINGIVHNYQSRFSKISLKDTRNASINRLNQVVHSVKQQINKMKNLAAVEMRSAYLKINRFYHETIHNLSHAKDANRCVRVEQIGEHKINGVFDQIVGSNSFKQAAYDAITNKVHSANLQIDHFSNLGISDQKTGQKLLGKIKQQTVRNINGANGVHDVYVAENRGTALIKQVIDKISSADVMVAAVQSAHNRISRSHLGREQKQQVIKQINAMISSGIKHQSSASSSGSVNQKQGSSKRSKSVPHYRYIVKNQFQHKQSKVTKNKNHSRQALSRKLASPMPKGKSRGYSNGYRDGINNKDEDWGHHQSSKYVEHYQKGYRLGHEKYNQSYDSGSKAGRIRGMTAKPMIKLNGLSRGYVDGYVHAYRDNKITLPIKIYVKQPLYLHSDVYFNPNNRIKKYSKRHRALKVTEIVRRNDGSLCYRVDGGYITSNPAYVTRVLADSVPRVVKVINPKGIYVHKNQHFDSGNIMKLLSKGTRVKVANVVHDGNKGRFQLKNGYYITSDHNQVKKAWL